MEVKRDAYLQQLIERKDNGVGADHIIEIALDGIENEELRDPKMCFKHPLKIDKRKITFFDAQTEQFPFSLQHR